MGKQLDLTGQKFGNLTAIKPTGASSPQGGRYWLCKCDCGNFREVTTHNLRTKRGGVKSCNLCAEKAKNDNRENFKQVTLLEQTKVRRERLHGIWQTMKSRCYNPHTKSYPYYGARGIRVCREWNESYRAFKEWAFRNGYNDNLTIERIDVNGDYCPENCKWIELREQFYNKQRTHCIYFQGKKIPIAKMVYDLGLDYGTMIYYLKNFKE